MWTTVWVNSRYINGFWSNIMQTSSSFILSLTWFRNSIADKLISALCNNQIRTCGKPGERVEMCVREYPCLWLFLFFILFQQVSSWRVPTRLHERRKPQDNYNVLIGENPRSRHTKLDIYVLISQYYSNINQMYIYNLERTSLKSLKSQLI
jgi:hypothetical protein